MQEFLEFLVNSEGKEYWDEGPLAWVYPFPPEKKKVEFSEEGSGVFSWHFPNPLHDFQKANMGKNCPGQWTQPAFT